MTRLVNKYQVDLTGKASDNLVIGEQHFLNDSVTEGGIRVIVPNYGGYYTDSLAVYESNGNRLKPRIDYVASFLYEDATHRSGLEVCGTVLITNPRVGKEIYIDYQAVGGDIAVSTTALEEVLQALKDDERPVDWGNIIGKPNTYPSAGHLHALWELYGFEYVVIELERVTQAIIAGYQPSLDEVREYALTLFNEGKDYTDALDGRFRDHQSNVGNPHEVTKAQTGLGLVDNYPTASTAEAESGSRDDRFMTPKKTTATIDKNIGDTARAHMADKSNPHEVTKAQTGLGLVENHPLSSIVEAEEGRSNSRYMTPKTTAAAVDKQIGVYTRSHVNDRNNPHEVTKTQVGLSRVNNYSTATGTDVINGTRGDLYTTPVAVKQAIESLAGDLLNAHIADKTNPHSVTKSQVGLGNVLNYGLSTKAEAVAGQSNYKYMTPLRTREAFLNSIQNYATKTYVDNKVASQSLTTQSSNSSTLYLESYSTYLVSVHAYTTNRGNGGRTLIGIGIKNSAGSWLAKVPNKKINWHDGSAPQSAVLIIKTPADGKITGHSDGGVLRMDAVKLS